jgi:hypothetical protein
VPGPRDAPGLTGEPGRTGPDGHGPGASTWNAQGNGNEAFALVAQSNKADQSQSAEQKQLGGSKGCGCDWKPKACGCEKQSEPGVGGSQTAAAGDRPSSRRTRPR